MRCREIPETRSVEQWLSTGRMGNHGLVVSHQVMHVEKTLVLYPKRCDGLSQTAIACRNVNRLACMVISKCSARIFILHTCMSRSGTHVRPGAIGDR